MLTDRPSRSGPLQAEFLESDRVTTLELPQDDRLQARVSSIEDAMKSGQRASVLRACADFLAAAAGFYGVRTPQVRVLASRPVRVREGGWSPSFLGTTIQKRR